VLAILNSTRSTDIPALVQALEPAEQVRRPQLSSPRELSRLGLAGSGELLRTKKGGTDADGSLERVRQVTLMKYLYKAMEDLGDTSGNVVLGWHEKVRWLSFWITVTYSALWTVLRLHRPAALPVWTPQRSH